MLTVVLLVQPRCACAVWHGDHYDAVYHQGGHGGYYNHWGRKLMSTNEADSANKADRAQHGGWGGGHGGGHYDMREYLAAVVANRWLRQQ